MKRAGLDVAVEAPAVPKVVDTMFERIVGLHNEAEQLKDKAFEYAKLTVEKVILIGGLLTEKKAALEYGEWLPWCGNLPFSQKTVCNYMRCFQDKDRLVSDTNLTDAYRMIEAPGKGKQEEKMKPKDGTGETKPKTHTEEPPDEQEKKTGGEADDGEDFTESGDRPVQASNDGRESPKHALVAVLHTVRDKVEGIQRDYQRFEDLHGSVDKSTLKKFTEKEKSEVRVLLMQFDGIKRTMNLIKKSIGGRWYGNNK